MSVTPGEIILRRRSELGLSQTQLAERIGRAASTIRRWERGEAKPPAAILPTLASALQVAPRDLAVAFGFQAPPADDDPPAVPTQDAPPAVPTQDAPPAVPTPDVPTPAAPPTSAAPPTPEIVQPSAPSPSIAEEPTQAIPVQTAVAAPPQQRPQRRSPLRRAPALDPAEGLSYVQTTRQRVRYWLRGLLTIVAGVILLIVLFWAFGELGTALSDVWDLFGEDAPPATAPGTDF